jgi:hypothetical protein
MGFQPVSGRATHQPRKCMIYGIGAGLEGISTWRELQAGLCYSTPSLGRGGFVETPSGCSRAIARQAGKQCRLSEGGYQNIG